MDGILEQNLAELKEIKQLLAEKENISTTNTTSVLDTMNTNEAADYLGLTVWRLRVLTKEKKIPHFNAGKRFLYKRKFLDQWLEKELSRSVEKGDDGRERIRRIEV